jgi:DNA-binding winged helix-turn-helix (wHTH) protein
MTARTPPDPTNRLVRFGVFELDLQTGELRKKGARVALQEQPFQVLAMLVARPGELVTREELRTALWSETVFVDFDHGLNKAVGKIRRALGDMVQSPRFVETLDRRGYRFIAPVESGTTPSPTIASPQPLPLARLALDDRTVPLAPGVHDIGRDPVAAVWINSSFVSRRHARLVVDGRGVTLEDTGSHNGTFVNGERVTGARLLQQGDEIRVGPFRLILHVAGIDSATRSHGE